MQHHNMDEVQLIPMVNKSTSGIQNAPNSWRRIQLTIVHDRTDKKFKAHTHI
jgi:hypothetical protein